MSNAESRAAASMPEGTEAGMARANVDRDAVRRVMLNAIALIAAYVAPRLLTIGAIAIAARVLGTAGFGAYGAAGAAAVIMSNLSTVGMQPLLVRELARAPRSAPRLLRSAHRIKTGLNVVMLLALWALAGSVFGLAGEALWAAMLLGAGYAIGSYAENFAAYFQAVERMHVWTRATAAYGIVAGIAATTLILWTHSLTWFCVGLGLGQLAAVAWLYRAYRADHTGAGPTGVAAFDTRALLRAALPFAAAFTALAVFYKADVLLLARARSAAEVGIYTAAYKLVDVAQAMILAGIIAAYPPLARAAVGRPERERWVATRLAELALMIVAPVAALGFLLREPILTLLYGVGYNEAAVPAGFLLLALVPLALNLLGGYVLAATDRMKVMAALYATAAAVKLSAVAVLASRSGAPGVALAMLGSELLLGVAFMVTLWRLAHAAPGGRTLVSAFIVLIGCAIVSWIPDPSGGALRAALLILVVCATYSWLDLLPMSERVALREALRFRTSNVATLRP